MKFLSFLFLVCSTAIAITSPLNRNFPSFQNGTYFGEGSYITASSAEGTYTTIAIVDNNDWGISYLRDGEFQTFSLNFNASISNHFSVELIEFRDFAEVSYEGKGYCFEDRCHLVVDMNDRIFEETLFIDNELNRIERVGSISNPKTKAFIMSWKDALELQIDDESDEDYVPE